MERYLILMNLAFYALLALTAMYANDKLKEHEEMIKELEKKNRQLRHKVDLIELETAERVIRNDWRRTEYAITSARRISSNH